MNGSTDVDLVNEVPFRSYEVIKKFQNSSTHISNLLHNKISIFDYALQKSHLTNKQLLTKASIGFQPLT